MADTFPIAWTSTPTAFSTLTNLHSLADGNIWNSGVIASGVNTAPILQISYNLVFNSTPVAGDYLGFWVIGGDDDGTTPYWPGSISETEGEISTAAAIAAALAAVGNFHHGHFWQTSHGTTFRGSFLKFYHLPDWQLLIRAVGEALASSGNVVRYRYGVPSQSSG